MTVYLIRHTTPEVPEGICYGQTDLPLKNTFEAEAQNLRNRLRKESETMRIFSSPLSRCAQLAAALWPGQPAEVVDALKELDFGHWENRAWKDLEGPELDRWMADFVYERVPGGESYQDLNDRCSGWWDAQPWSNPDASALEAGEPAAIITHAGPIRSLLCHVCGTALDASFQAYKVPYGGVYRLEGQTGGPWTARLL